MIAAAAFAGITALLALVVVARIMLAASPQASAESALSPGLDQANTLLLEQATGNAREQATRFAADAGATLGQLKNANQGVIRVILGCGAAGLLLKLTALT